MPTRNPIHVFWQKPLLTRIPNKSWLIVPKKWDIGKLNKVGNATHGHPILLINANGDLLVNLFSYDNLPLSKMLIIMNSDNFYTPSYFHLNTCGGERFATNERLNLPLLHWPTWLVQSKSRVGEYLPW
jgi:hypothetical protein